MKEPAHLALHPFGQIPTYEEGDLALFETGAIVFHIAQRHAGLLSDDANARARARANAIPSNVASAIWATAPGIAMARTDKRSLNEKCRPTPNISRITPISAS